MAARMLLQKGIDPIDDRAKGAGDGITFSDGARRVHAMRGEAWDNGKHHAQWLASLENHVLPVIGDKPLSSLTRSDGVAALSPIWLLHPETARRVKQRIKAVVDWSVGEDIRTDGINFSLVSRALPRQPRNVRHIAAINYTDVPRFMQSLSFANDSAVVRVAIEFVILTASRPGNIRFMTWSEVDSGKTVWSVPAEKMKMKRPHLLPVPPRGRQILDAMEMLRTDVQTHVFFGIGLGKPMSENTKCAAIQNMGFQSTAHGFRSCFKDWSRGAKWEDYLSEFQLAHVDGNKSREPYGRDGQLALRREMMADWADYIAGEHPTARETGADRSALLPA